MRFEVLAAFRGFARESSASIQTQALREDFIQRATAELSSAVRNPRLLYSLHAQVMFRAMAIALGKVRLIKEEDSGEVFAIDDSVVLPDYRIVLDDGTQLLVEVKNFYQQDLLTPFARRSRSCMTSW